MFSKKLTPILILSGAILAGCASSPQFEKGESQTAYLEKYLNWRLEKEMDDWHVRGLSIAVVSDREVLFQKGYGWQDESKAKPSAPNTAYRAGSLTKLLTATVIMKEVEEGRLELGESVSSALPGFDVRYPSIDSRPITIEALLSHHSGLPPNLLRGMFARQAQSHAAFKEELNHQYASLPAGQQYRYSNLDYAVLGQLLERTSGATFSQVLQRQVLTPLDMKESYCDAPPATAVAIGQGHRDGGAVPSFYLRDSAAGCLVTTASDMGRFLQFVLKHGDTASDTVLRAATVDKMFKPSYPNRPLDFGQQVGIGWLLNGVTIPHTSEPLAWHTGMYPGYFSAVVVSRQHKLGVVILANDENAKKFALDVASEAIEAALSGSLGRNYQQDAVIQPPAPNQPAPDTEAFNPLGSYAIFGNLTEIHGSANRPSLRIFDRDMQLESTDKNKYKITTSLLGFIDYTLPKISLEFVDVAQQRYAVLRGMPSPLPFENVKSTSIPQKWKDRLGQYVTVESDENMTFTPLELREENGILVAQGKAKSDVWGDELTDYKMVLRPISENLAVVVGLDGLSGGVARAEYRNGVAGLSYSGYFFAFQGAAKAQP